MFLRALFAGLRGRFSTSPEEPRNPANVNARKNMFDRYYCIKVSKKSILQRYFDVLFWHFFVFIFLHWRMKIIACDTGINAIINIKCQQLKCQQLLAFKHLRAG